jgi:hypothetical protein
VDVDQRAAWPEQAVCFLEGGDHVASVHAAERPGKDGDIERRRCSLGRELVERGPAQADTADELLRQVLRRAGYRGRERLDGGHGCRSICVAPGQPAVAASDLEDAASIEFDEVEQGADLVLLRIDSDRHSFELLPRSGAAQ